MTNRITIRNVSKRLPEVQRLLLPLRPRSKQGPRDVSARLMGQISSNRVVVVACDGQLGNGHRECYFSTAIDGMMGQYFEEWVTSGNQSVWELHQACLHLFRRGSPHEPPDEILALHCEPGLPGNSTHDKLKKGPHVHVRPAGPPLSHAHFPLNFSHLEDVLRSMQDLTPALQNAVEIVVSEVINAEW